MFYYVFLDTNIYENARFSFSNEMFSQLKEWGQRGILCLQINSLVQSEVELHISNYLKDSVDALTLAANDSSFAGLRNIEPYKTLLTIPAADEWSATLIEEFHTLINECNGVSLPMNGIDVEKIVEHYRRQLLPFEKKKPNEFKDAMIIGSILQRVKELDDDSEYCVVSADKGFRTAIKREYKADNFFVFSELPKFFEHVALQDERAQFIKNYLEDNPDNTIKLVQEAVDQAVRVANINVYTVDEYVDDLDIESIDDIEYTASIVALHEADGVAKVVINAMCSVTVSYEYVDEDQSYYDREDGEYLWMTVVRRQDTNRVPVEIIILIDIGQCNKDVPEDDRYVEFLDYDGMTDTIDLTEDTLESFEIISASSSLEDEEPEDLPGAYNTCPDCGCRINFENDGGNGFCINCAPNH